MEKHFFNSNHSDIISEIISFLDINDDQENIVKFIYFVNGYEFTRKIVLYWKKNSNYRIEEEVDDDELPPITQYFRNGQLHRDDDLPAEISDEIRWYKKGKLHRGNDLPAIILYDNSEMWYKNGELHRDNDLPAIIYSNGTQMWYKNGKKHRDNDLPAIIKSDGSQEWWKNGNKIKN